MSVSLSPTFERDHSSWSRPEPLIIAHGNDNSTRWVSSEQHRQRPKARRQRWIINHGAAYLEIYRCNLLWHGESMEIVPLPVKLTHDNDVKLWGPKPSTLFRLMVRVNPRPNRRLVLILQHHNATVCGGCLYINFHHCKTLVSMQFCRTWETESSQHPLKAWGSFKGHTAKVRRRDLSRNQSARCILNQ